ncbi:rod shape-determining protein MreC [Ferrigenium sp. UT5]|uniref:rod shape-determining protein MreC n=1 Tax=Ferrigenium sp. UT5 TaxID=3242105 RepID=UPI0038B375B0
MLEDTRSLRFFNRGPSAVARLIFFSVLSLCLLFVDAHYRYLESTRQVIAVVIYPFQRLTALPGDLWHGAAEYVSLQRHLVAHNEQLRLQHDADAAQLRQFEAMLNENAQLRGLLEIKQRADYTVQAAQIVYLERDIFKRKLFVDIGAQSGVEAGRAVVDNQGVVGQVTRTFPWLSEVTLVTDKDNVVPVQVVRNGLRAAVFGSGNISEMELRYQPVNADVEVGDELVTSGLDGTYPPLLPVAKVVRIERDPAYPFAHIVCAPLAGVDRHRTLLIVSAVPPLPARPPANAAEEGVGRKKSGKRGYR